jgi:hypothetical protein
MKAKFTDQEIEQRIREAFELNYEMLRLEGGHAITPDGKQLALNQVLFYWRKLRDVAERVTDTEVKLSLPEQRTPKGRKFSIEGVVDIVREEQETWMYDIKTHDPNYVKKNLDLYEEQLNVYAYIWQTLRGQPLNHTAVIATSFPDELNEAIKQGDERRIAAELERWQPLIEIPFNPSQVDQTIREFGAVVDEIEDGNFKPRSVKDLKEKIKGDNQIFATRVCRNCDARFSCDSYREYAMGTNTKAVSAIKKYIDDLGNDVDVEDWKTVNLENTTIPEAVEITE